MSKEDLKQVFMLTKTGNDPLKPIAELIAGRLSALVQGDGRFVYHWPVDSRTDLEGRYNILRHAGSTWMLSAARHLADPEASHAVSRANGYLTSHHVQESPDGLCVVENNESKLGGDALAVLALLEPHTEIACIGNETLDGLVQNMIVGLRQHGWSIHKREASTWKPIPFQSDYYVGEALFACTEYARRNASARITPELISAFRRYADLSYGVEQQSHWMLYALESLNKVLPVPWVHDYAQDIAANIVARTDYRDRGMSTPVACRTEGLLCFLRLHCSGARLDRRLVTAAMEAVRHNVSWLLQFVSNDGMVWRDGNRAVSRIDYLQHTLATMLDCFAIIEKVVERSQDDITSHDLC